MFIVQNAMRMRFEKPITLFFCHMSLNVKHSIWSLKKLIFFQLPKQTV